MAASGWDASSRALAVPKTVRRVTRPEDGWRWRKGIAENTFGLGVPDPAACATGGERPSHVHACRRANQHYERIARPDREKTPQPVGAISRIQDDESPGSMNRGFATVSTQCAPEETRTPNLLIRSQMLYPLSYGRPCAAAHKRPCYPTIESSANRGHTAPTPGIARENQGIEVAPAIRAPTDRRRRP